MKKIVLSLFISLLLVFATACGQPSETPEPTPEPTKYTVSFIDENGTTLSQSSVEENKIPSYSYSVTDTDEYDYTFEGWSLTANGEVLASLPAVTTDISYYAIVSKVKQIYTVNFEMNGAAAIESQSIEYGNKATEPDKPQYEGHKFVGWFADAEGKTKFDWNSEITQNTTVYAFFNEVLDVKSMLSALLNGYKLSPYTFIPEALQPNYEENLVSTSDIVTDYSNFVNVSSITSHGFGEQWNVVVSNLNQSMTFHNVLAIIESISTTTVTAFNNYFDSNPSDTAHYVWNDSTYNVTINFDGETLLYVVDYSDTLPVLGSQTIQIALSMNVENGEKTVRIQLGNPNALVYTISENEYSFAIKYLGIRRAYLSLTRNDNGEISGHIYEYLTYNSLETESAVDFYIYEDYTSVVGNKASGLIGFTGTICEIYENKTGKLVGYEVEETISSLTYNTLWFTLDSFSGFNTIRYVDNGETQNFYVNGSSSAWEYKTVGGFSLKALSRRFDIEFRKQYFYSYNSTTKEYEQIEVEVPMLFVQEEVYDDLVSDVKSVNNITISNKLTSNELNSILNNYDVLLPIFKTNKDNFDSEIIVTLIGNIIVFD